MSLCITIGIKKELILYIIVCLQVLGSATAHLKKTCMKPFVAPERPGCNLPPVITYSKSLLIGSASLKMKKAVCSPHSCQELAHGGGLGICRLWPRCAPTGSIMR